MTRRLHAVADLPQQAVDYRRVSEIGSREEIISPEIQGAANIARADTDGWPIVETLSDIDRSGRTFTRDGIQEAIAGVEEGRWQVILVYNYSRFGRNARDSLVNIARIKRAGGRVISATEPFDDSTAIGRYGITNLLAMAELQSDLIGEGWQAVHKRRIEHGLPHTGGPRFGYRYARREGYSIDPVTGPVLAEVYERYNAGQSPRRICEWLNDQGVRTTAGGPWRAHVLRDMMALGFGAGFIHSHGELLPGAHEPVIDSKAWQAYLVRRRRRTKTPSRTLGGYPLSGLLFCARCGRRMQAWHGYGGVKRIPRAAYKCPPEGCARCYCAIPVIHDEVKAWLADGVAKEVDDRAAVKARTIAQRATARADVHAIRREAKEIDRAIKRLTDGYSRRVVPERAYRESLADLVAQREGLDARAAELTVDSQTLGKVPKVARSLLRDYDALLDRDPEGLGEVLRQLISGVIVTPGDHRHLGPRKVRVVARWE